MFELDDDWCSGGPEKDQLQFELFGGVAVDGCRSEGKSKVRGKQQRAKMIDVDHPRLGATSVRSTHGTAVVQSEGTRKKKHNVEFAIQSVQTLQKEENMSIPTAGLRKRKRNPKYPLDTSGSNCEEFVEKVSGKESKDEQILSGRRQKQKKLGFRAEEIHHQVQDQTKDSLTVSAKKHSSSSTLHSRMYSRMEGARFRWINEQLYTTTGEEANELFRKDPKLFTVYHKGFAVQVDKWPMNPLDRVITYVCSLPTNTVVADFGCGTAKLSQSVPHQVYSFDLVASNDDVIACDMAHTPLQNSSVDVVIFCLSLMGVNIGDFIAEAARVLKECGRLKVCEIASRFDSLDNFVHDLESFGFQLRSKEVFSKMFVDFEFQLVQKRPMEGAVMPTIYLKPCLYKKR